MKNRVIIILLALTLIIPVKINKVNAKNTEIDTPKNLIVWCKDLHTLKMKWSKLDKVSGYKVYRYQKSQKKYKVLKTLGAKKTKYTDKNLKKHKIYKYKVAAFIKGKDGKKYGKKHIMFLLGHMGKKQKSSMLLKVKV